MIISIVKRGDVASFCNIPVGTHVPFYSLKIPAASRMIRRTTMPRST